MVDAKALNPKQRLILGLQMRKAGGRIHRFQTLPPCPNCQRPGRYAFYGSTEWTHHNLMVCSPACGERLDQKLASGMIQPESYDDYRYRRMRIRIKMLERHRR